MKRDSLALSKIPPLMMSLMALRDVSQISLLLRVARGVTTLLVAATSISVSVASAQSDPQGVAQNASAGIVTLGNARFSVITPYLVRIEQAPDGAWVDASSLFALHRAALWTGAKVRREANRLTLDTGALRVYYTNDSKPFNAQNLRVEVRRGQEWTTWTPEQNRWVISAARLGRSIMFLVLFLSDGLLSPRAVARRRDAYAASCVRSNPKPYEPNPNSKHDATQPAFLR